MSELRHPRPDLPTYAEAMREDYEPARIRKERMERGEDPWTGKPASPELIAAWKQEQSKEN